MMRRLGFTLAALLVAAVHAHADGPTGGMSVRINGKVGTRFTVAPLASSGVRKSTFLTALDGVIPGASTFVVTNLPDCPTGPICREVRDGAFVEPGDALATWLVGAPLNLPLTGAGSIAAVFTIAGAVVSGNGQQVQLVVPSLAQLGAAAADLSNVNALAARTNLGVAALDLSNVNAATARTSIGAAAADLSNVSAVAARSNLGLAGAALREVGTTADTVASGAGDARSFSPAVAYRAARSNMIVVEGDLTTTWWDQANQHFVPSDGGGGSGFGLYNSNVSSVGSQPSLWQEYQIAHEKYWEWKAGGLDLAKTKLNQQWAYLRTVFSDAQLSDATTGIGIEDDASWKAMLLAEVYEVTGDQHALRDLGEVIAATAVRFKDPLQAQMSYGTSPGGIAWSQGPYGMLYAAANDQPNIQQYGYISSSYEVPLAIAAEKFYRWTGNGYYHSFALDTYKLVKANMLTPAPSDGSRPAQYLVYRAFELDPNVANASAKTGTAQPQQVYHKAHDAYFGKPVRGLDSTWQGGLLAQATLAAMLFEDGTPIDLSTDIDRMGQAFVSLQGYGRLVNGQVLICNCQDPFTNGTFAPDFAYYALALAGVDASGAIKQALINTTLAIFNTQRTGNAYGADWSGPEANNTPYATWQANYNANPGNFAGYQQLMTSANSANQMRAGAIIADWSNRR